MEGARRADHASKTVQSELVYPRQFIWVLPVVLYDIDIVGGREEAAESRGFGVP